MGQARFIQHKVLEPSIHVDREQLIVTEALRRGVKTPEQLRANPLAEIGSALAVRLATLEGIVTSGRTEVQAALQGRLP